MQAAIWIGFYSWFVVILVSISQNVWFKIEYIYINFSILFRPPCLVSPFDRSLLFSLWDAWSVCLLYWCCHLIRNSVLNGIVWCLVYQTVWLYTWRHLSVMIMCADTNKYFLGKNAIETTLTSHFTLLIMTFVDIWHCVSNKK